MLRTLYSGGEESVRLSDVGESVMGRRMCDDFIKY